jgi:hypothetical protein
MLLLAFPAAELLVSPAVSDLITALQTSRNISGTVLIFHNINISMSAKLKKGQENSNSAN